MQFFFYSKISKNSDFSTHCRGLVSDVLRNSSRPATTAEATKAKTTTEQATTAKPTTEQVTTAKPTTEQATTAKPTTADATTVKTITAEATTAGASTLSTPVTQCLPCKSITTGAVFRMCWFAVECGVVWYKVVQGRVVRYNVVLCAAVWRCVVEQFLILNLLF